MTGSFCSSDRPESFFGAIGSRLVQYQLSQAGNLSECTSVMLPLNVQYGCFDAGRALAYVVCSDGGVSSAGNRHQLVQLSFGRRRFLLMGEPIELPHRPIHVVLDDNRRRLAVAYNRPAALTVHGLNKEGLVQGSAVRIDDPGVVGHFPHQAIPMPGSDDLLLTCRGDNATAEYGENPGSLRVIGVEGDKAFCAQIVAPNGGFGFGPRNCAFHPKAPWLYAVLERQNALSMFRTLDGAIGVQPAFTVGLLDNPLAIQDPQLAGAIVVHPDGRTIYVVNRSHAKPPAHGLPMSGGGENSIVVFSVDPSNGRPRLLQRVALQGMHARCAMISQAGNLLIAAVRQPSLRRKAGKVTECPAGFSIFRIVENGRLDPLGHHAVNVGGDQLFWAGLETQRW
ncbi:lactonase family protein [Paralcaligenes sp. KSB-10]|uniref:beta-propeller fold lactonase family protein n=1 Tax=Paralcaligenes sp. KSB-10 TaxID=2901142 RepID=UPI001E51AD96|nr:beta-propeller fold lactonase family protein [Paralcaligenes sp. KSB-10]UHL63164.1 lactonase family protein [Paralcaligenes sp. KSB-10]